jgi:hypothetical protein
MAGMTAYERSGFEPRRLRRRDESDASERAGLAIVVVLVGGLIAGVVFSARLLGQPSDAPQVNFISALTAPRSPERAQSGFPAVARPAAAAEAAPPVLQPHPTAAPTAVPAPAAAPPAAGRAVVARTDGEGVVLRASPRDDDWTPRGFMDGASVSVLERQGSEWVKVRGDNGSEGWIPSKYLDF